LKFTDRFCISNVFYKVNFSLFLFSDETIEPTNNCTVTKSHAKTRRFEEALNTVLKAQQDTSVKLSSMQNQLATIQCQLLTENNRTIFLGSRELFLLGFMLVAQLIVLWWIQKHK